MNWRQQLINPVLNKEFRLRMRSFRSPLTVMIYVAVLSLLAFGFIYAVSGNSRGGFNISQSRSLFYFLSGAQLVLVAFMTPGLTAGVISGEREKQTLNILLTTQQSSMAIVLGKLVSSLSFMVLLVFATLPVYSIVFLYGGISPVQLVSVFMFYLLVMFVMGSFGVFFSSIFKKTMISVIVTYGMVMLMFGGTGIIAIFMQMILMGSGSLSIGMILGLNPMATLIAIFNPDFSDQIFGYGSRLQLWHVFVPVYTVISVLLLWFSARFLRPVYRR